MRGGEKGEATGSCERERDDPNDIIHWICVTKRDEVIQ